MSLRSPSSPFRRVRMHRITESFLCCVVGLRRAIIAPVPIEAEEFPELLAIIDAGELRRGHRYLQEAAEAVPTLSDVKLQQPPGRDCRTNRGVMRLVRRNDTSLVLDVVVRTEATQSDHFI